MTQLQLVNGMGYVRGTQRELIRVLEMLRHTQKRATIHFGAPDTGEAWHTETGYIRASRATRPAMPVVASHRNSSTGASIETDTVVLIEFANKKDGGVLWRSK